MTESEIFAAMIETGNMVSQDFEFFITLTFAVIFVVYTVGKNLPLFPRIIISALYLSGVVMFLVRYQYTQEVFAVFNAQLEELDSQLLVGASFGTFASSLRWVIYVLGSIAALYSIFRPTIISDGASPSGEQPGEDSA